MYGDPRPTLRATRCARRAHARRSRCRQFPAVAERLIDVACDERPKVAYTCALTSWRKRRPQRWLNPRLPCADETPGRSWRGVVRYTTACPHTVPPVSHIVRRL